MGFTENCLGYLMKEALQGKYVYLEILAAAFLGATKLKPTECELVEDRSGTNITYYFRKRVLNA